MKSLYDRNFRYTDRAVQMDVEAGAALKPIFSAAVEAGYNPREIARLLMQTVNELEMESILDAPYKPPEVG